MARFPALLVLLTMTLSIAACGGGEAERAAPSDPGQQRESAPERAPIEEAVPEGEQEEPTGSSVTTIQGEEVWLGGQGEVTALFFMAGW
jgi:hypothetical protein